MSHVWRQAISISISLTAICLGRDRESLEWFQRRGEVSFQSLGLTNLTHVALYLYTRTGQKQGDQETE